jgi:hypothetical protein
MAIRNLSILFGALYGYSKPEKRDASHLYKFGAIVTPLQSLIIYSDYVNNRTYYPILSRRPGIPALIGGPLVVGMFLFIGNELGELARKSLNDA